MYTVPYAAKLTQEQVKEIVQKRAEGMAYNAIAAEFGISGSRVYELTHPEKQAEKAAALKAKRQANKKPRKGRAEADSEGVDEMDVDDVDYDDDDNEGLVLTDEEEAEIDEMEIEDDVEYDVEEEVAE
jgi:transposase